MKEFGIKDNNYYYVVYFNGEKDRKYEKERREIINYWEKIEIVGTDEIVKNCMENPKPYGGIPYDNAKEILAIVVALEENICASFLRIAPTHRKLPL